MLTGYADIKAVIDAINLGHVYRHLTKPCDPDELLAVLHQACHHYDVIDERRRLLIELGDHVGRCQSLLQESSAGQATQLLQAGFALLARRDRALASKGPWPG